MLVLVLLCAFFLFLVPAAFRETSLLTTADISGEHIEFREDNVFLNLLVLALQLCAMYLYFRHSSTENLRRMELALLIWVFLVGTAFIASSKVRSPIYSDSFQVTYGAQRAALGDYALLSEKYFYRFPFQLGYVLYSEIFFRVANLILRNSPAGYSVLALQEVNLLWLLLMLHALLECSLLLFRDRRIHKLLLLLAFFCLPPVLTVTFLYGIIPAFSCGTLAVWMFLLFLRKGKILHGLLCALFLGLAVTFKLNLLIFCVALAIIWLLSLLKDFSLRSLCCLVLTVASALTLHTLPQRIYERRVGVEYGDGIPMISWLAMGLSEGRAAPGWYREDNTVTAFEEADQDSAATAQKARQMIAGRLSVFRHNPGYARRFFSEKLRSQWNEPSYGSLWVNQVFPGFSEKGAFYRFLCESGRKQTFAFMDSYQQLVFLGVLLGILRLLRRRELRRCLLPLILLGGLLYHLLFEAKSQYAMPYFLLMLPIAAYGFYTLFRKVEMR